MSSFQINPEQFEGTQIVGLGYKARSGKDTVASYLVEYHGFTRVAFADKVKEVGRLVFGFSDAQLYGEAKEIPDDWWNDALAFLGRDGDMGQTYVEALTPRRALQRIGTESFRDVFHEDIWVAALFRTLEPGRRYVISDVRFPNEADAVLNAGGELWRIDRSADYREAVNEHISETALDGYTDWTLAVNNNYTLDDLKGEVARLAAEL